MKIRMLELQGFKSFVDRTVLAFDHDVTAVVGPNGCGKSNTVDAIRWCMGEQSARHLRGRAMEDVIFNGSDSRPAHGFAEVTLVFDNRDGMAPAEYSAYTELAVTRRLSRDGASDYFINRTPVRLMDVTNLFLGTGAGTKAYSIVEQGRVGLIVTSKAEDRRALIEEASGITRFKARRKLAERRLELTRQNLTRVGDLLTELEKGLATLERQAQRAQKFKKLRAEQRELDLWISSAKFCELVTVGERTREEIVKSEAALEGVSCAVTRLDAETALCRRELFDAEVSLESAQGRAFTADNEVRSLDAEIKRVKDRVEAGRKRAGDAERDLGEISRMAEVLGKEREGLKRDLEGAAEQEAEALERLSITEEHWAEVRELQAAVEAGLRSQREVSLRAERELATAEATRMAVARRLREAEERSAKAKQEARAIERRAEAIMVEVEGAQETLERLKDRREVLGERLSEMSAEVGPLRHETAECEKRVQSCQRERERGAARLGALREVLRRHEGVAKGVRALLDGRDTAVKGLLSDGLAAEGELARATAAALGERWQDVRVEGRDDAVRLVTGLRAEKKGRAAVVFHAHTETDTSTECPRGPGVRGKLLELLAMELDETLTMALENVVVCESLASAVAALESTHNGSKWRFVTVDGELLEASGRLVGGVAETAGEGIFQTQAELRVLGPKVEALDVELEEESLRLDGLKARARGLAESIEAAKVDLHAQELAIVRAERDARAHEAELAQGKLRLVGLGHELAACEKSLTEAMNEDLALDRVAESARAAKRAAVEGLAAGEQELEGYKSEVERAGTRVTDAKVIAARARERANGARNAATRLERSVDELGVRRERLTAEITALGVSEREGVERIETLDAQILAAISTAESLRESVALLRSVYETAKTSVGELEARTKSVREERERLQVTVARAYAKAREETLAMEHLVSTVAERHGVALAEVVDGFRDREAPAERERERWVELGRAIERLGEVNLTAIEEYEAQSRRREFFATQKADIELAVGRLEAAIGAMNKESRRRFRETFDAVNEHFKVLFPRLFRGGKGELQMSGSDDLLECGVEIVAQPPGKKLISLEAMSGGEKTLTAVTLLFALFLHKPSPFCLLDEVEAALDEANVTRLVELVRELTDRSQFILITHNKRTMAMADVLYGITMQEPGVSKMVSVKVRKDDGRAAVA